MAKGQNKTHNTNKTDSIFKSIRNLMKNLELTLLYSLAKIFTTEIE